MATSITAPDTGPPARKPHRLNHPVAKADSQRKRPPRLKAKTG
jgi:hypothetical protein